MAATFHTELRRKLQAEVSKRRQRVEGGVGCTEEHSVVMENVEVKFSLPKKASLFLEHDKQRNIVGVKEVVGACSVGACEGSRRDGGQSHTGGKGGDVVEHGLSVSLSRSQTFHSIERRRRRDF